AIEEFARTVLRAIFSRLAIARTPSPSAYVRRSTSARRWATRSSSALMADGGRGGEASDLEADLRVARGHGSHDFGPQLRPADLRVGPGHRQHNVNRAAAPEGQQAQEPTYVPRRRGRDDRPLERDPRVRP